MRFLQKWIPTRPACKDSERWKRERFCKRVFRECIHTCPACKECEQVKWARFASNFWQGCIHICLACQFSNRYKSVQLAKQEIQMLRMFALLANKWKALYIKWISSSKDKITDTVKTTVRWFFVYCFISELRKGTLEISGATILYSQLLSGGYGQRDKDFFVLRWLNLSLHRSRNQLLLYSISSEFHKEG